MTAAVAFVAGWLLGRAWPALRYLAAQMWRGRTRR